MHMYMLVSHVGVHGNDVRSFPVLVAYRRFIRNFAAIAKPLNSPLHKHWGGEESLLERLEGVILVMSPFPGGKLVEKAV